MSEDEKEAIENVKDILKVGWCLERADIDNIETIIRLAEKQQNLIKVLEKENDSLKKTKIIRLNLN